MKEIHRNFWRVAAWIDYDDLVQMIYFHWYRIVMGQLQRGPRKRGEPVSMMHTYKYCTDRRQVMALFQSTFKQHLTDLANNRTNHAVFEADVDDDFQSDMIDFGHVGTTGPDSAASPDMSVAALTLKQAQQRGPSLDESACIEIIDTLMQINSCPRHELAATMLGYIRAVAQAAPHLFAPINSDLTASAPTTRQCRKIEEYFNAMRQRVGKHVRTSDAPRRHRAVEAV